VLVIRNSDCSRSFWLNVMYIGMRYAWWWWLVARVDFYVRITVNSHSSTQSLDESSQVQQTEYSMYHESISLSRMNIGSHKTLNHRIGISSIYWFCSIGIRLIRGLLQIVQPRMDRVNATWTPKSPKNCFWRLTSSTWTRGLPTMWETFLLFDLAGDRVQR